VDFTELLRDLARSTLPDTMTARLHFDPNTPILMGHYDPLRRAFSNLLRNAAEACKDRGELEIVTSPDNGGGICIEVRDHGPGVAPEQAHRIFDPYYTGKAGGTGLGLALVKQTIEMHGGTIALTNTPGGGATFQVRMKAR
jgi:two-component system OmpR family sensor kinase